MSLPIRRTLLLATGLALALTACTSRETQQSAPSGAGPAASAAPNQAAGPGCAREKTGYPQVDVKNAVIGFSQSEKEANPFRIAETQSIKDEAKKLGVPDDKLLVTNAQSDLNKQVSDIKSLLDRGAQLLIVAPLNSDGLQPALDAAKAKKVPVITIDRKVTSQPCTDYLTFIGSNFVEQGKRAAQEMVKATGGTGKVAILLGASGNNVTTDRTKGFKDEIAATPGIQVVAEQTGEFDRSKGQAVMEQLIQSNPEITAVYAENDEMGIGAVTALKAAGKTPGKDVKIVSIDGTRNAVQLIADGSYNAVIESNPRFGPLAFSTLQDFAAGKEIPSTVVISDDQYDSANAAQKLGNAY
ncbi:ABC transporter substrate-binding protein [Amycolatopsis keratiniphila]|uniref:LacI family transcriptional regulator n=1 Tax=Amycolatopsis keratiniphila subsp. keratiniphila TaxID=227715 RepID=A0A1W2LV82_9PSEU|nr:ABC transporter substrate-binding protein [Amycolatopsis keratiniphila]OLZ61773.1 LacI family transcriptional regulator [Amycolatopsis keratiniphila subsp. nogabecina]ONF68958.1 LacI family transcriptional regulator [Amycolatopsis keratiniphila subsp. keratiniphila]SDU15753.1 monosaccharide ABC transporter substrate-binding protein, CUT2 family [Amycolatopsis keratiniphila]